MEQPPKPPDQQPEVPLTNPVPQNAVVEQKPEQSLPPQTPEMILDRLLAKSLGEKLDFLEKKKTQQVTSLTTMKTNMIDIKKTGDIVLEIANRPPPAKPSTGQSKSTTATPAKKATTSKTPASTARVPAKKPGTTPAKPGAKPALTKTTGKVPPGNKSAIGKAATTKPGVGVKPGVRPGVKPGMKPIAKPSAKTGAKPGTKPNASVNSIDEKIVSKQEIVEVKPVEIVKPVIEIKKEPPPIPRRSPEEMNKVVIEEDTEIRDEIKYEMIESPIEVDFIQLHQKRKSEVEEMRTFGLKLEKRNSKTFNDEKKNEGLSTNKEELNKNDLVQVVEEGKFDQKDNNIKDNIEASIERAPEEIVWNLGNEERQVLIVSPEKNIGQNEGIGNSSPENEFKDEDDSIQKKAKPMKKGKKKKKKVIKKKKIIKSEEDEDETEPIELKDDDNNDQIIIKKNKIIKKVKNDNEEVENETEQYKPLDEQNNENIKVKKKKVIKSKIVQEERKKTEDNEEQDESEPEELPKNSLEVQNIEKKILKKKKKIVKQALIQEPLEKTQDDEKEEIEPEPRESMENNEVKIKKKKKIIKDLKSQQNTKDEVEVEDEENESGSKKQSGEVEKKKKIVKKIKKAEQSEIKETEPEAEVEKKHKKKKKKIVVKKKKIHLKKMRKFQKYMVLTTQLENL